MSAALNTTLVSEFEAAAVEAGLELVSASEGADLQGHPTAVFLLGLPAAAFAGRTLKLELSQNFAFDRPELLPWRSRLKYRLSARLARDRESTSNPDSYETAAIPEAKTPAPLLAL